MALQRATEQLFVAADPIGLRRIEEIAAKPNGAVNGSKGLLIVRRAVGMAHPHAAEPDLGDF